MKRGGLGGLILLVILLFILFNTESVKVNIIVGAISMPIAFVIIFSVALGAGSAYLFLFIKPRMKKKDGV